MSDTQTILVAGTASHVGKSTIAAGLCRLLADRGVDVAPFKAQNMSNNARAVPAPNADAVWGEIGVSQYVQARAARTQATTDHNPVLLKPHAEGESQLVLDGRPVGTFEAGSYYEDHWHEALDAAKRAHDRLTSEYDVVVAEGAGSIAEINLHDRDLANVETARFADADVLLVADIERGGVFASLVGTLELLPDDVRERVVGAVVNKFRGDVSLLEPGLDAFEDRTGVPILGVLPYDDPGLPEEDSVSLPPVGERAVLGGPDGRSAGPAGADRTNDGDSTLGAVRIGVVRLPRASNVTDVEPLAAEPGVRVVFCPPSADLSEFDAVVIPGTKNSVDDLLACREAGLGAELRAFDGPVVGLCGGYQLLGERIENASVEGTGDADEVPGFGLLPVVTRFSGEKVVRPTTLSLSGTGPLAGASGEVSGYEIHVGRTRAVGPVETPFAPAVSSGPTESSFGPADASFDSVDGGGGPSVDADGFAAGDRPTGAALGAVTDQVCGTYLHGLFENRVARRALLDPLDVAGADRSSDAQAAPADPYERAATLFADAVDAEALFGPLTGSSDR